VAKKLIESGDYEDSVSRAYYSAFNATKALLASADVFPKTHRGVVSRFGEVFVKEKGLPKELGRDLHSLQAMRENVEYTAASEAGREEAEWALGVAERLLREAMKLSKE